MNKQQAIELLQKSNVKKVGKGIITTNLQDVIDFVAATHNNNMEDK